MLSYAIFVSSLVQGGGGSSGEIFVALILQPWSQVCWETFIDAENNENGLAENRYDVLNIITRSEYGE